MCVYASMLTIRAYMSQSQHSCASSHHTANRKLQTLHVKVKGSDYNTRTVNSSGKDRERQWKTVRGVDRRCEGIDMQ